MGHSTAHIWREIETLIAKTMIAITPELKIEMSGEVPPGTPALIVVVVVVVVALVVVVVVVVIVVVWLSLLLLSLF